MTTCYLAPDPIQSTQFIPGGNTPANGGQLFFYVAGSVSTKQTVYKDNAAATPWTNPIVLDSGGNLPSGGEVWFPTGQTFKVVFAPSNDQDPPMSPYWSKDNLSGMNDVSVQTGSEWIAGPAPTFVSGTQFTLVGDQTANFTMSRRLKTTNTAGTVYSTIVKSVFGVVTTVTVVNDASGVLDSGLSTVFYGIFDPANPSIPPDEVHRKSASVASAANGTTDIWGIQGDFVHVTGVNTIFFFSTAPYAGAVREVIFDGALSLNNNPPALSIPGNASINTNASTRAIVRAETVSTHTITQILMGATGAPPITHPTLTVLRIASGNPSSSGTYTPPTNAVRLHGKMCGAGAGGASDAGLVGKAGSSTVFGALIAGGGAVTVGLSGGDGGTNTTSYTAFGLVGGMGASAMSSQLFIAGNDNAATGGSGGANPFGGSPTGGAPNNVGSAGKSETGAGGGGGGGNVATSTNSGAGGGAGGFIEFYISVPAVTSFAYTVGTGGSGGTNNQAGGRGGSGVIYIEEYYV